MLQHTLARTTAALIVLWLTSATARAEPEFTWPKGAKAAVNLAYDDALDSQLDKAIPALNQRGLRATFYLSLNSPSITNRLHEWRAAAQQGHELGNHSLFHQCSAKGPGREWVSPAQDLSQLSREQMQAQTLLANSFLFAIDGQRERTYTPPCLDVEARDGNFVEGIKQEFVAIKGAGQGAIADIQQLNRYAVPTEFPVGSSGAELIALVKTAAERGTMISLSFHGVGGDHLSISEQAHSELLDYLAQHQDIYWTDSLVNIMRYVNAQQGKHTKEN